MLPEGCQILLLEDDPAIRTVLSYALRNSGFTSVTTAETIAAARIAWREQQGNFNLILADFSLPDGCGTDFIEEVVRTKPGTRAILMTGFSEEALELSSGFGNCAKVMEKPFRPNELIEAVCGLLGEE